MVPQPDYFALVRNHRDEVCKLREFESLKRLLDEDPIVKGQLGKVIGTAAFRRSLNLWEILEAAIVEALELGDEENVETRSNYTATEDLLVTLYDTEWPMVAVVPLGVFELRDREDLDLGPGVKLRKLTDSEFDSLCSYASSPFAPGPGLEVLHSSDCLEVSWIARKIVGDQDDESATNELQIPARVISAFVSAARLVAPGNVTTICTMHQQRRGLRLFGGGAFFNVYTSLFVGTDLVIDGRNCEELVRLYRVLLDSSDRLPRNVALALRRLNSSRERFKPEDALVDIFVAFESLLLRGTSEQLGFRYALRLAKLLGRSSEERAMMFEEAKRLYRVRSRVVHGAEVVVRPEDVRSADGLLRRCLLELLELTDKEQAHLLDKVELEGPDA